MDMPIGYADAINARHEELADALCKWTLRIEMLKCELADAEEMQKLHDRVEDVLYVCEVRYDIRVARARRSAIRKQLRDLTDPL